MVDIQIGLTLLAEQGRIKSKVADGANLYSAPVSDFEKFLDFHRVSQYYLAEAGIDPSTMSGYVEGKEVSRSDAKKIADALSIDVAEVSHDA